MLPRRAGAADCAYHLGSIPQGARARNARGMSVAHWVELTAALLMSCGRIDPQAGGLGEAGDAGRDGGPEPSLGGRWCAVECSVFCGTREECTGSGGGQGGFADAGSGSFGGR